MISRATNGPNAIRDYWATRLIQLLYGQLADGEKLEDAFVSQRSFVAHASHELRTSLTNTLGTLETSLRYDQNPAD